jgi:hypothetical protein
LCFHFAFILFLVQFLCKSVFLKRHFEDPGNGSLCVKQFDASRQQFDAHFRVYRLIHNFVIILDRAISIQVDVVLILSYHEPFFLQSQ